ncbi:TPA: DUF551 domain-containing protein [Klebsiella pneumoniae]|nr:DUF551 domain-containing protein [Klebsiella pneumoniae]HBR0907205.1 DUF551 domain-containing protein [Klebsiella pneumoniae]HBU5885308.1 DUF551 domain-containing protein [Klebsiella pneumoniae]
MDGVLNNYINTNTTFSTREKAEAYGKGGSYEMRSDGRLEWVPNTALDPVVVPLYRHAQPVPRVPDGYVMVPVKPTREILDEFDSIIDYGAEDSEDAWRRLLAAAPQSPGSEPATVPGKWIPVSERMPDDNSDVLCTAEFDGPGDWRRKVGYWHEGKWVVYGASWTPTHWMPLPAAPVEVK